MEKTQELFSYPIVIIESLWPKLPEEAPKLVGESYLNIKDEKERPQNAYIYSETQNAFSGYFKVIPLNVKSISINAGKDGHTFNISFDPSYVYIQFNPKYVSRNLYNYIIRNSFQFTRAKGNLENTNNLEYQDLNYLSGILEGFSKSQMEGSQFSEEEFEHYFVPGNVISKFINEMDTVTIFLVQDLGIFDQTELIKLAGGGFSRRREVEVFSGTKKLTELGIVKPSSIENLAAVTMAEKLQSLRSLLFNNSLGRYSYTYNELPTPESIEWNKSTSLPTVYELETKSITGTTASVGRRSLLGTQIQENVNINNAIASLKANQEVSRELDAFGPVLSAYLYDFLIAKTGKEARIASLTTLKNNINNYYLGKAESSSIYYVKLASTMSWTLFKSLLVVLEPLVDRSIKNRELILSKILKTIAIDLYLQNFYGETYVNVLSALASTNEIKLSTGGNAYKTVEQAIKLLKDMFAKGKEHYATSNPDPKNKTRQNINLGIFNDMSATTYFDGLDAFFMYAIKPFILADENQKNKSGQRAQVTVDPSTINVLKDLNVEDNIQVLEDLTQLQYPMSCETPFFVLNGHISKISDNTSISGETYTKGISISGTGFELPMKTHQIYIDATNGTSTIYAGLSKTMLSNATPIAAALSIMSMHLPDYVQFFEKRSKSYEYNKAIKDQRNFALFSDAIGFFVDKGTVLNKTPGEDEEDSFFVLAPIHYIDKSYLKIIKSTFDSTLIAAKQVLTEQRSISNGTIYDNLRAFLSNSSMYSFFIDEFGTMKLRFEPSAVAQTSSTILSPIITDSKLTSLTVSSDQGSIQTLVEVLPKPMSVVTGQAQTLFYSRATPPDIVDAYGLYKILDLEELITSNSKEFFEFLEKISLTFIDALEVVADHYTAVYKSNKTKIVKPVVLQNVVAYDTTEGSLKDLVDVGYETAKEKAEKAAARAKAEAEAASVKNWIEDQISRVQQISGAADNNYGFANTVGSTKAGNNGYEVDHCVGPSVPAEEEPQKNPAAEKTPDTANKSNVQKETITRKGYEHFFKLNSTRGELSPDYRNIVYSEFQNYSSYVPSGNAVIPFTLNSSFFSTTTIRGGIKNYAEIARVLGEEFTYLAYVRYRISSELKNSYEKNISKGGIFYLGSLATESIDTLIDLLSTLARFGILGGKSIKDRLRTYISPSITDDAKTVKNYVSWVVKYTTLFYIPARLKDLGEDTKKAFSEGSIVEEKQSRRVPFSNFTIQEFNPRTVSVDFFRYGLRRMQQEDFYAQTSKLTDFRAETLRKLYEQPMKTAAISTLLTPMYKVGNNVLVMSENLSNNKGTYLNLGLKKLLEVTKVKDSENKNDAEPYNLYIRVDDIVKKEGVTISENKLYSKLTGITGKITESMVINHFKQAAEFLVGERNNSKGLPVPSDAYVPLYGIYSNKNRDTPVSRAVVKYLKAVLDFNVTTVDTKNKRNYLAKFEKYGYAALYQDIEDSVIGVYKAIFGNSKEAYSIDNFNLLSRFLQPQNYHVYQYHINGVTHEWKFGNTAQTNIAATFGLPCLMTYIPTDNTFDSDKHVLGYLVTRGPNHYFNDYGTPNLKLTQSLVGKDLKDKKGEFSNENVAYKFSEQQMIQEEKYYKSKYRYNLEYILEKIRRKYTMPELYGNLIFRKSKVKK